MQIMTALSHVSEDLVEKTVAFVDHEDGHEPPLTAPDEAMVRQLIEEDPSVRDLADDLRATNAGLDMLLEDVAEVRVPGSLVAMIRSHKRNGISVGASI